MRIKPKSAIEQALDMFGTVYAMSKASKITQAGIYRAIQNGYAGRVHSAKLEVVTRIPRERFMWPDCERFWDMPLLPVTGDANEAAQSEKCPCHCQAETDQDNGTEGPQGAN